MQPDHFLTSLLGIQGWSVVGAETRENGERPEVVLTIERDERRYLCGGCGQAVEQAWKWREQEVQHLMLWEHVTWVKFCKYRVVCPTCGVRAERVSWVQSYGRVTGKLAQLVKQLCKVMTNQAVGLLLWLHPGTVKQIDKRGIQAQQKARALDGISTLGVDEIAVGKGQQYWHLVHALDGPRGAELLFVGQGRKEKDLEKFWRWFGKRRAKKITHAVMDMWKGFAKSFRAHCAGIQIIYDKFHCVRHLLNALNEIRRAEFRQAGGAMRGLLCGKKFILLSRASHLRRKARQALNDLLQMNRKLYKAHLLKESFGQLWSYRSKTWAKKFWTQWKEQLKWSRLGPYQKFARMIDKHFDGILAYCDKKVPLGYIEGSNLKAKNIIRRAYGYRDKEYMKLKLIQGCSTLGVFTPWEGLNNNSS